MQNIIEEKIISFNKQQTFRIYQKGNLLGRGGFARCFEIKEDKPQAELMAVKVISKANLKNFKKRLLSEININKQIKHKYIVQAKHIFQDTSNVYIIMQLCKNSSLENMIKRRRRLYQVQVQALIRPIFFALAYLKEKLIIHRDIKPGNIFLHQTMIPKLADFGLACKLDYPAQRKKTLCGTSNYMAPQIHLQESYSFQIDIWAMGCLMYCLLTGKPPFHTTNQHLISTKIKNVNYTFPDLNLSSQAKCLISKILTKNQKDRPTIQQILNQPFFNPNYQIPAQLDPLCLKNQPPVWFMAKIIEANPNMNVKLFKGSDPLHKLKCALRFQQQELKQEIVQPQKIVVQQPQPRIVCYRRHPSFGVVYKLSSGLLGMIFNDGQIVLMNGYNKKFSYITPLHSQQSDFSNLQLLEGSLKQRAVIAFHMRAVIGESTDKYSSTYKNYVISTRKDDYFQYFVLSNKTNICLFRDGSQFFIRGNGQLVFSSKEGKQVRASVSDSQSINCNQELSNRMRLLKERFYPNLSEHKSISD